MKQFFSLIKCNWSAGIDLMLPLDLKVISSFCLPVTTKNRQKTEKISTKTFATRGHFNNAMAHFLSTSAKRNIYIKIQQCNEVFLHQRIRVISAI